MDLDTLSAKRRDQHDMTDITNRLLYRFASPTSKACLWPPAFNWHEVPYMIELSSCSNRTRGGVARNRVFTLIFSRCVSMQAHEGVVSVSGCSAGRCWKEEQCYYNNVAHSIALLLSPLPLLYQYRERQLPLTPSTNPPPCVVSTRFGRHTSCCSSSDGMWGTRHGVNPRMSSTVLLRYGYFLLICLPCVCYMPSWSISCNIHLYPRSTVNHNHSHGAPPPNLHEALTLIPKRTSLSPSLPPTSSLRSILSSTMAVHNPTQEPPQNRHLLPWPRRATCRHDHRLARSVPTHCETHARTAR